MGPGDSFLGVKAAGALSPSSAEVNDGGVITPFSIGIHGVVLVINYCPM
jgi:hypothetical protein